MKLQTPLSNVDVMQVKAGDWISLSGVVYTARDAAHKRMVESLQKGELLPFDPAGAAIYYLGPSPTPPGRVIGAAGPTTSYRMDPYTPLMASLGIKLFIGKGQRSLPVRQALLDSQALYLAGIGGAAAWLAQAIKQAEVIAYPDLGPEAVRRLYVQDLELICINDCHGNDYYEQTIKY